MQGHVCLFAGAGPLNARPGIFKVPQHACSEEDTGSAHLVHAALHPELLQQGLAHLQRPSLGFACTHTNVMLKRQDHDNCMITCLADDGILSMRQAEAQMDIACLHSMDNCSAARPQGPLACAACVTGQDYCMYSAGLVVMCSVG